MSVDVAFIDFEASASVHGYPIQAGWAFVDGRAESHLIRPIHDWLGPPYTWDPAAEKVHGITRDQLLKDGEPPATVVHRINEALSGLDLYSDAPANDWAWLRQLYAAARVQVHLRLSDLPAAALMFDVAVRRGNLDKHFTPYEIKTRRLRPPAIHDAIGDAAYWARFYRILTEK